MIISDLCCCCGDCLVNPATWSSLIFAAAFRAWPHCLLVFVQTWQQDTKTCSSRHGLGQQYDILVFPCISTGCIFICIWICFLGSKPHPHPWQQRLLRIWFQIKRRAQLISIQFVISFGWAHKDKNQDIESRRHVKEINNEITGHVMERLCTNHVYIYANNIQINSSHDTHPGDEPLVSPVAVTEVLEDRGAALLSVVNLFLFSWCDDEGLQDHG